jgi:hypothetical protein
MPRTANETKQSQFRLSMETLSQLDQIAKWLKKETGIDATRSDVIRYLAHDGLKKIPKKTPNTH